MCSYTNTDFSAKEPSLGYYYQILYGLYLLLSKNISPDITFHLENLDDIDIEQLNSNNVFQTKLHIKSKAQLSDRNTDFWKTIRIWSKLIKEQEAFHNNKPIIFTLITTAKINDASFIKAFSTHSKEERTIALNKMRVICNEQSSAAHNIKGYQSFTSLTENQQLKLINSIYIVDSALSISETKEQIKEQFQNCILPKYLDNFSNKVIGWWFIQCIDILNNHKESISSQELSIMINDLRDEYRKDDLPNDFPRTLKISTTTLERSKQKTFVMQLMLISESDDVIKEAISDYRRAFNQQSKWIRDGLAGFNEFARFQDDLQDYWQRLFALLKSKGLDEEALEHEGRDFFENYFVKQPPAIRIRSNFQSTYFTIGSYHMLSDEMKVGWHPCFKKLLNNGNLGK